MKSPFFIAAFLALPLVCAEPEEGSRPDAEKDRSPVNGPEVEKSPDQQGKEPRRERQRGRLKFDKSMSEAERERLMYLNHLIMEKYDGNKNGRLDKEEMDKMKEDAELFRKERHAMILKKYDKDGDGKLNEEEREAMKKDVREEMEKRLKEKGPRPGGPEGHGRFPSLPHQEGGKDKKADNPRRQEGPRGPNGMEGPPPHGKSGERSEPGPEAMIMIHGHHLVMEKFDKDKDGKLSEEEIKAMKADQDEYIKKWKEHRAKRRAAMEAKRAEAEAAQKKEEGKTAKAE